MPVWHGNIFRKITGIKQSFKKNGILVYEEGVAAP